MYSERAEQCGEEQRKQPSVHEWLGRIKLEVLAPHFIEAGYENVGFMIQ